ncbi:hypothetical protein M427DRAFT_75838 [Gonapodya prolifera JEL478]|uniref:Afadin and alpha-actinin-binding-domain-containing protein n=1 Tax=Gonapodya prolifera (strain JEL478) TaxID=1344416 RepID=A0A138ZXI5_GONPJ|nr:hypothetical protein M427DRAFT_75838 [Gonapodya prolifera JEL478]|eukprot:KXS09208.1 hypothetical protein M427DRAFT_75838 [Gonapodya prolifera JEL478]
MLSNTDGGAAGIGSGPGPVSAENLRATCDFLNRELSSLGFPSPLKLYRPDVPREDTLRNVNCVFAMLQQRQRDIAIQDELQERLRRLQYDHDQTLSALNKTRSKLETSEREVDSVNARLSMTAKSLNTSNSQLSLLRDEVKQARGAAQQIRAQCQHELKRELKEQDRLRERLNKVVAEKQLKKGQMTCINGLRGERKPFARGGESREDDLYHVVLSSHTLRERDLLDENLRLRRSYYSAYEQMRRIAEHFLTALGTELDATSADPMDTPPLDLVSPRHGLQELLRLMVPFDPASEAGVEDAVEMMAERCKEAVDGWKLEVADVRELARRSTEREDMWEAERRNWESRIGEVEGEVAAYKRMLEEQAKMIEMNLAARLDDAGETVGGERISTTELARIAESLEEERNRLEEDRKKFTEAAIRMGKERAVLQRERSELDEERRSMETRRVLQSLPETPGWLRSEIRATRPGHSDYVEDLPQSHHPDDNNPFISDGTPSKSRSAALSRSGVAQSPTLARLMAMRENGSSRVRHGSEWDGDGDLGPVR